MGSLRLVTTRIPRALVLLAALGLAALAFLGALFRLTERQADQQNGQRLRDFQSISYLAARESRLIDVRRTDPETDSKIRALLVRLERSASSDRDVAAVVTPAVSGLALGHDGKVRRAQAAFSKVRTAARAAIVNEAVVPPRGKAGLLRRAADGAASLAAVLAALLGAVGIGSLLRRRKGPDDQRVEELAAEARTDSLTGLGNLRAFNEHLAAAIERRDASRTPFVLLAIDLDGLKQINDSNGHLAGDDHIKRVADSLKSVVAADGHVYRTGGDEFMVLLPGRRNWDGLAIARRIAEKARLAVGRRAVSIGVTESTGSEGRHLLVGQADIALYEAKRTRLNAVVFNAGLAKPAEKGAQSSGPSAEQRALASALARAVDAKDVGTQSHCETVAQLCVAIGERLGVGGDALERLRLAGLLHDVGKIGVADVILQKPGALDDEEKAAMAEHVQIGNSILIAAELPVEAEWILYHHERYDGMGYPERRRAAEIPLGSRIISVADAFEAMIADRPYRASIPVDDALAELREHAGRQFDGRCVEALAEAIVDGSPALEGVARAGERSGASARLVLRPAPKVA